MRPQTIPKAILLALGIAGGANAAQIDVIADDSRTVQDATLGVRVLTGSQTWTKDNQYILTDRLFIKSGQTLTIEPGTRIYGSFNNNGTEAKTDDKVGSIIACRGGRLVADGTSTEPIIFSSIQDLEASTNTDLNGDSVVGPAPTSAQGGQWGGILLLGNAYVSQADSTGANIGKAEIEGFLPLGTPDVAPADGLADAITYGFDATFTRDDADDSGIIRYVSIRHGGYEFASSKEINGLTMGGVGSGTIIEFVEVYANTDDGFEWFGGTNSTKNLVSAFNQDDSFDVDSGHTGTHQFLFAIQNPGVADGGSELDGIESTPSSAPNMTAGFNNGLTLSKPVFYNMTLIGPGSTNTKSTIAVNTGQVLTEKGNHGFTIEDYFNGEFYNSVFHDFTQDLAFFRDNATSTGATPAAAHNTVGSFGDGTPGSNATYITGTNSKNLFYTSLGAAQNGNSNGGTNPVLRTYTRTTAVGSGPGTGTFLTAIDPRPATNSPLLPANGATLQGGAPVTAAYRGAFGGENWASSWTKLSQSGVLKGGLQLIAGDVDVIATPAVSTFDAVLGVQVLNGSQTWTSDKTYIITDRLFIKSGQTLTIEPGTKVFASFNDNGTEAKTDDKVGSIIACRGGRLVAEGTSTDPIVFSSIQDLEAQRNADVNGDGVVSTAPTSAQGGQWGGILLLGNAYVSQADSTGANIGKAEIEGFLPLGTPDVAPADGLADAITYGFDATFTRDDADDSGIIRYVSIRHGGYEFASSKEINGLTMGGVGSGTIIEFVEVYANTDDGFEWFGGTNSTKNLVSAFNQDDSFDVDSGHTGTHQFLFAIQNPGVADGGSELDGIESTPSSAPNMTAGFNNGLTLSKPVFYNMTLIGPGSTNTKSTIAVNTGQVLTEKGNHGFTIEDYFNGEFYNSVFHDFTQDLAFFRDNATSTGATPAAAHNTVGSFGDGTPGSNATYITGTNSKNLFYTSLGAAQNGNSNGGTNPVLRTYTRTTAVGSGPGTGTFLTAIDPRPATNSPLLPANGATLQGGAPIYSPYRGAFGSDNWADGWTRLSTSGLLVGGDSAPFADADGDGISDSVEAANTALGFNAAVNDATAVLGTLKTTAQFNDNFTAGQTSVTANPNAFSLYTLSNIQDLSADDIIVQKSGSTATLNIPVESSNNLVPPFTSVGNATLTIPNVPADKQFYRFRIAAP